MNECRSCGAPIRWARTEKGKRIPLDVEPVGNLPRGAFTLAVEGDDLLAKSVFPASYYVSHFATCPCADEHRKTPV